MPLALRRFQWDVKLHHLSIASLAKTVSTNATAVSTTWTNASPSHLCLYHDLSNRISCCSLNLVVEDDAPFVIARKLLRRRHVKKEQLRKEREAREALNVRDTRSHRKRKAVQLVSESTCKRVSTAGPLPHPSPMLAKSDSFVGLCQTTEKDQGNVDGEAVLGSPSVANTMIFHSTSLITFSPLRSRTNRS
jgi:hypothetical protein